MGNKVSFNYYCHYIEVINIILYEITSKTYFKTNYMGIKAESCQKNTFFRIKMCVLIPDLGN